MMLGFLLPFLTLSTGMQGVVAQSDASCLPFYNWTFNSHKKSPCEVASSLLTVCNDGPFLVDALPDTSHCVGPSLANANPCQCNTVTYSLMSACGACQGQRYLSWSVWSANCATVYISTYPEPIPSGVSIPGWAYLDVKALDNFDQSLARQNANITESTAIRTSTSSSKTSIAQTSSSSSAKTAPPSAPSPTSSSPAASPASASTESTATLNAHANAVGGGVVGGLLGVMLLLGGFIWYVQRRRRMFKNAEQLVSPTDAENPSWKGAGLYTRQNDNVAPRLSAAPSSNSSLATPAMFTAHSTVSGPVESAPAGSHMHAI